MPAFPSLLDIELSLPINSGENPFLVILAPINPIDPIPPEQPHKLITTCCL